MTSGGDYCKDRIMERVATWLGGLDWHEVGRVFLIMSAIGVLISCVINRYLKNLPALAV